MVKLLLVCPHSFSYGGYTNISGDTEHDFVTHLMEVIRFSNHIGVQITFFTVNDSPFAERQASIVEAISIAKPDIAIELHYNWLSDQVFPPDHWLWSSTTALINFNDTVAKEFAEKLVNAVSTVLHTKERRVQTQVVSWETISYNRDNKRTPNGGEYEILTKSPRGTIPVVLETHVGNHFNSHQNAITFIEQLADAIINTVREHHGKVSI